MQEAQKRTERALRYKIVADLTADPEEYGDVAEALKAVTDALAEVAVGAKDGVRIEGPRHVRVEVAP